MQFDVVVSKPRSQDHYQNFTYSVDKALIDHRITSVATYVIYLFRYKHIQHSSRYFLESICCIDT